MTEASSPPVKPVIPSYARNGYKYDQRLTAMMIEDMIFDPVLAAKVILGIEVPPHMELRINMMWTTHQTNDDSGFSTGKSFTFACVSALRSILFSERISGVLSGTFRQGKLIFQNFDKWYEKSKIFANFVKHERGAKRIIHGSETHEIHFVNLSTIRVLPPNFVSDAERLRSERWNDAYLDEWTIYGNFGALTKTILGRVTEKNSYPECPIRQNHIHLASTPGYTHQPAYKIIRQIAANINAGSPNYRRFTANYRHLPKKRKWQYLVNRKVIFGMQTLNPPSVVKSEIDGIWQDGSMSFYSAKRIDEIRRRFTPLLARPPVISTGKKDEVFVAAFDMARGQKKGRSTGDDFALTIWRIPGGDYADMPCMIRRKHGITADQASGIIHENHRAFGFKFLVYDPGGGGIFVRDELRKVTQVIRGEEVNVTPICEFDDPTGVVGDAILVPFSRGSMHISRFWGKMMGPSVLVNRMHEAMKNAIDSGAIVLPAEWEGWGKFDIDPTDPDSMRQWLNNRHTTLTEMQRARAELDLMVLQIARIDVKRDAAGEPVSDQVGQYKFMSKAKKDSAYSCIYGHMAVLLYKHFKSLGMIEEGSSADDVVSGALINENNYAAFQESLHGKFGTERGGYFSG